MLAFALHQCRLDGYELVEELVGDLLNGLLLCFLGKTFEADKARRTLGAALEDEVAAERTLEAEFSAEIPATLRARVLSALDDQPAGWTFQYLIRGGCHYLSAGGVGR